MSNLIDNFVDKKKAESQFISLEDSSSVKVLKLKDVKEVEKTGFGGELKSVLRLTCEVETPYGVKEKFFDNGTQKFAKLLSEKKIDIGSSFTITRVGIGTKTQYALSDVKNIVPDVTQAAPKQIGVVGAVGDPLK